MGMNNQQQAKKIAEMWKIIAENEGAYFMQMDTRGCWFIPDQAPDFDSNLDKWRVHVLDIEPGENEL